MSHRSAKSKHPSIIGRYEIVKRIGAGGMGTVYQAIHQDLGRRVALKVLPPEMAVNRDSLERFQREAKHAAKLRHENIVTLYEISESKGTHFIAMEYVEGCNLQEYIEQKGKLDPEEARRLAIQSAKALSVAHTHGIIHRDIKPSNLLLAQRDGRPLVKLTDFGLARTIDDRDFKVTKTGTTVGTVDYIAPEQARNSRAADIRSDIYSLGCTLYHMLAGRAPFAEGDMTERLLKHLDAKPQDIRVHCPMVPPGLVYVLEKMLEKKPEDRYQAPEELIAELENLPTGPPLSSREVLEALAIASGEKVRASRKASPGAETRKTPVASTQPLDTPDTNEMKLRYRHDKKKRSRLKGEGIGFVSPIVVEGWGPRLLILGAAGVIILLCMAVSLKWGGKKPVVEQDEDEVAEAETKDGKGSQNDPTNPANAGKKEDIAKASKNISEDLKAKLKERRGDSDTAADREAFGQLMQNANLEPIQIPGQNLLEDLRKEFQGNGTGAARRNLGVIQQAYQNLAQGNIPTTPDPAANLPPIIIPGITGPTQGVGDPQQTTQLPPNIQSLLSGQQQGNAGQASQISPQAAAGATTALQNIFGNTSGNPGQQTGGSSTVVIPSQSGSTAQPANPQAQTASGNSATARQPATPPPAQNLSGNSPMRGQTNTLKSSAQPPAAPQSTKPQTPAALLAATGTPGVGAAAKGEPRTEQQPQEPPSNAIAPPYVVSRGRASSAERRFNALEDAIKAALAKESAETLVIEIQDNGPLFEKPIAVRGRNLVLRAGQGYRPLIIWDPGAVKNTPAYLISVTQGSLALADLDLAASCSEAASGMAGLVRVDAGDLLLVRSTISVSGKHSTGLSAIRLEGIKADGTVCRGQLDRCFLRGSEITALDVRAPSANIILEDSLLVGGQRPLIRVLARNEGHATEFRLRGCTLVAGNNLLRVDPVTLDDLRPAVYWLCWDSLLARNGQSTGGVLLDLLNSGQADGITLRSVNCFLTGWETLLHYAKGNISATDEKSWQAVMKPQGELLAPQSWPTALLAEPGNAPAAYFQVIRDLRYASTYNRGALGCDITRLPRSRDKWQAMAFDTVSVGELPLPRTEAPAIPPSIDGKDAGQRVDLSAGLDLGASLQAKHDEGQLASQVVYHLQGKGEFKMSPLRLKNINLTLYVDPSDAGQLTLLPAAGADRDALFELDGGSLTLVGVGIRFANSKDERQPAAAIKMQFGDLRLSHCRIQGPLTQVASTFRALILFDGAGERKQNNLPECVVSDSILMSGKACLESQVSGSLARFHNNVLFSLQDALVFQPGSPTARVNASGLLDNNTFAALRCAVRIGDAPALRGPVQPMLLQAQSNVFLDPFEDPLRQVGILLFEDQALSRSLLTWQGKGNAYDKRIHFYVGAASAVPAGWKQGHDEGLRLLGLNRDEQAISLGLPASSGFALDRPPLERLALSPALVQQMKLQAPIGVDFELLGLAKKK